MGYRYEKTGFIHKNAERRGLVITYCQKTAPGPFPSVPVGRGYALAAVCQNPDIYIGIVGVGLPDDPF